MYKFLGDVMRTTSDHEIEKWILFLPVQMPSFEYANMISDYLERDAPIADDNLLLVIQAVASLHRAQAVDGVALLKKFPNRFGLHHQEDVERIWRNDALVPEELKGIFCKGDFQDLKTTSIWKIFSRLKTNMTGGFMPKQ